MTGLETAFVAVIIIAFAGFMGTLAFTSIDEVNSRSAR